MQPVIRMHNITKVFPRVVANEKINLDVNPGEIHALLGENGAGKSTLMNILYGLHQPSEGEIFVKERKVVIADPNVAIDLGIGMVHQHFMLIPPMTVSENIVLGCELRRFGFLDMKRAEHQVAEISQRYGLKVDPKAKIENISVGMQQRVEILKALYRGAEILILDEPTAVLTPQEIQELFEIMRSLISEGKSIIFITHKLKEIMAVADRVTVIRRGRVIETLRISETNPKDLAEKMVGREVSFHVEKKPFNPGEAVLEVKNLHAINNRKLPAIKGVSLEVRRGEVLGIAGVDGNGQSELIEAVCGLRRVDSGSIKVLGKEVTNASPRKVIAAGISHIPEDRQARGLVLDFSIEENMVLETYHGPEFSRGLILNNKQIEKHAKRLVMEFDVRPTDEKALARSLSGGNQQKVIIAREVDRNPELLIAAQPTRGLDIGAIEFVHKRLIEQRDKGKAVMLISLDLDEIMALSDRIAVLYEGKIVGIVSANETSEGELGLMMAGATLPERSAEGGMGNGDTESIEQEIG
ncbi:MAG TPA: ABC transporter ATP-binding protein [Verrucomicrobiae bacterium]|nr:ABC transporter ATP-binding protein [Verrucomicrobiae bacterium]